MISLRIDVSKIDKARLFKGEKGTYLDCVLIETPAAKHGNDYMIVESITKEEREAGKKGTILGNGKTIGRKEPSREIPAKIEDQEDISSTGYSDSMPF